MSEEASGEAAEWLSVSQAAARLGVSEKTLLRRIKSGTIEAHKEALPAGGTSWRVHLDNNASGSAPDSAKDNRAETAKDAKDSVPESQRTETTRAGTVPEVETDTKDNRKGSAPELSDTRAGTAKDSVSDTFTAHLIEENRFLRAALEARDRDAAELRAALRRALEAMPRALPQGVPPQGSPSGDIARDATASDAATATSSGASEQPGASAQSGPQIAGKRGLMAVWNWFSQK